MKSSTMRSFAHSSLTNPIQVIARPKTRIDLITVAGTLINIGRAGWKYTQYTIRDLHGNVFKVYDDDYRVLSTTLWSQDQSTRPIEEALS